MASNRRSKIIGRGIAASAGLVLLAVAASEIQSSWLQSELLSSFGQELTFDVEEGSHPHAFRPSEGPHNRRLGYVDLDRFTDRLDAQGFTLTRQAGLSEKHQQFVDLGGFPIFKEKSQAGLKLLGHKSNVIANTAFPARVYPSFDTIPLLITKTLLFIENRELLDPNEKRRNPAVDWSRLAAVLPGLAVQIVDPGKRIAGGSTLATQLEKFRHSRGGQTQDSADKLRQMISASMRAYHQNADTTDHRQGVVLDYVNGTPLSARSGFGEVNGLGDGLWSWFGADFDQTNEVLSKPAANIFELWQKARAYKQVLALLIAQRRPSYYLVEGRGDLLALSNQHLRLLIKEGIVEAKLGEVALGLDLDFKTQTPEIEMASHQEQKAATALRTELLGLLGVGNLYELDRLDLTLESTIDIEAQQQVSQVLKRLQTSDVASDLGLYGHRLLKKSQSNDPLMISMTVYERGDEANYLRVQADNLDQPFDLNQGAKLDLGSTAKLRTLITYLEVIAAIHQDLVDAAPGKLSKLAQTGPDQLTRWVAKTLAWSDDRSLTHLLEAAMAKRYSANPHERFHTGGGLHRFANFNKKHNGQRVTVATAMRHSINLPLIRMMRDITNYHIGKIGRNVLDNPNHPDRRQYLERFAHREAMAFLRRFHQELAKLDPDAALAHLVKRIRPTKQRLAALHRFVRPNASLDDFTTFMKSKRAARKLSAKKIKKLYESYSVERFKMTDQAYLVRLHPLNLWLGRYLQDHASPTFAEAKAASIEAQKAGSAWLFKTSRKRAQNKRIRQVLEEEAFLRIHASWKKLGYPFSSLVPSYATSIGSSADRPEALATLVGIILNDGMLRPTTRIEALHFAANTPYETRMERRSTASNRVLFPEIASVVRRTMVDVVENGTARRLRGGFDSEDGIRVPIGAKTGTGDHRKKTFDRRGNLLTSEAVNRSATVVFFIGDRLFGNLTIFVAGEEADSYTFTSSLPAQLLKALAPALKPLMEDGEILTVEMTPLETQ